MKSHNYYYYPVAENEGKKCAGMCKQTVHIEVTMSEAFFMHDYPFDRQIIELGVTLRRGWTSLKKSPDWNDTGSVHSANLTENFQIWTGVYLWWIRCSGQV